jgi:hypothetical protein
LPLEVAIRINSGVVVYGSRCSVHDIRRWLEGVETAGSSARSWPSSKPSAAVVPGQNAFAALPSLLLTLAGHQASLSSTTTWAGQRWENSCWSSFVLRPSLLTSMLFLILTLATTCTSCCMHTLQ